VWAGYMAPVSCARPCTCARYVMNPDHVEQVRQVPSGASSHVEADHGGLSKTRYSCQQTAPSTRRSAHARLNDADMPAKPRVAGGTTWRAIRFTSEIGLAHGGMLV
jgi:hypothetical protein